MQHILALSLVLNVLLLIHSIGNYWERTRAYRLKLANDAKRKQATRNHARMKAGEIPQEHSYSLTYARKAVKELEEKVKYAKKLWS